MAGTWIFQLIQYKNLQYKEYNIRNTFICYVHAMFSSADPCADSSSFLAMHWYIPRSSLWTVVICRTVLLMSTILRDNARGFWFFNQWIDVIGCPLTVQLMVTVEPVLTCWVAGHMDTFNWAKKIIHNNLNFISILYLCID